MRKLLKIIFFILLIFKPLFTQLIDDMGLNFEPIVGSWILTNDLKICQIVEIDNIFLKREKKKYSSETSKATKSSRNITNTRAVSFEKKTKSARKTSLKGYEVLTRCSPDIDIIFIAAIDEKVNFCTEVDFINGYQKKIDKILVKEGNSFFSYPIKLMFSSGFALLANGELIYLFDTNIKKKRLNN